MKAWLSRAGVDYVFRDLSRDPAAVEEFLALGFLLPPVVVVDGEPVAGYQPDRLAELLEEG